MKTRFLSSTIAAAVAVAVLAPSSSLLLAAAAAATTPGSHFVAHEWGTFTSVQGVDGEQVPWRGPISVDLPSFVYRTPGNLKSAIVSRQRMETPVIYFYSDRERAVDVSVHFPQGEVTEWYPLKSAAVPRRQLQDGLALRWPEVRIQPAGRVPLPDDPSGSHYYSARETDAALLSMSAGEQKTEVEKFLFYRGNTSVTAPLIVQPDPQDSKVLHVRNSGDEELRRLFVCELDGRGQGTWLFVKSIKPGESLTVRLDAESGARSFTEKDLALDDASLADPQRLGSKLVSTLVAEGLFEKEATAMIQTWKSSWFSEKGTRVLYPLPRTWTDHTLPLKITPAPSEVARVMIARAEVLTPARLQALLTQIERYANAQPADRLRIAEECRTLGLGRFAQAALEKALAVAPRSEEFNRTAWELAQLISVPAPTPKITAAAN